MSAPASSPLRHRSPQKDPENGPTPKRPDSAAGNAATTAAAAADQPSFFKRHKKLIIFGLVIAGIVVIGAVAGTANSSDSTSSAGSLNTGSGSSSKTPSKRRTPAPTVKTTTKPKPTLAPTLVPAPKRTGMCAFPNNIGKAVWYNAFFEDSFWSNGSSVEGRLAVGKVAWVNQFSVGGALYGKTKYDCPNPDLDAFPEGADYSFVVGGELSINGSTVYNGGLAYVSEMEQGSADIKPWNVQNGCSISPGMGNAIVDFQGTFSQLRAASQAIASLPKALSFTSKTPGTLFFNLNGSIMTEFFNVKERDITAVKKLILKGTPKTYNGTTATIVINVIKDFLNENNTFSYSQWVPVGFTDAVNKYILWNFPGYEYIALRNGDWPGSILAPDASIENTIGNIRGSVYAKSWNTEERSNNIKIYAAPAFQGQVFWNNCPVETAAPTAAETP